MKKENLVFVESETNKKNEKSEPFNSNHPIFDIYTRLTWYTQTQIRSANMHQ